MIRNWGASVFACSTSIRVRVSKKEREAYNEIQVRESVKTYRVRIKRKGSKKSESRNVSSSGSGSGSCGEWGGKLGRLARPIQANLFFVFSDSLYVTSINSCMIDQT